MKAAGGRELRVESDLRLVVGEAQASIVADGQRLVIATRDAGRLLAEATQSPPPILGHRRASLRQLTERAGHLLDEAGLTASLSTDHGTVVHLGRDCRSRTGRVLLGTEHARLGGLTALLPTAAGYISASPAVRRRLEYAAGGVTIAVLFALARSRRTAARATRP